MIGAPVQLAHGDAFSGPYQRTRGLKKYARTVNYRNFLIVVNAGIGDGDRKGLKPQVLERMIEVLNDLNVKPEKGKRKGLKRIEEAIKTMSTMVSRG